MHELHLAADLVDEALTADRIGTPLLLRAVMQAAEHTPYETAMLLLGRAERWFSGGFRRVWAVQEGGSLTVHVLFEQGETALVSVCQAPPGQDRLELVLIGNHGSLNWEPAIGGGELAAHEPPADAAVSTALRKAVGVALSTGEVARFDEPGGGKAAGFNGLPIARSEASLTTTYTIPPEPFGLLLIAGLYTHQENYAAAFAADPRCRIVGLVDEADIPPRRAALNARLADNLGVPHLEDLDAALARDDVHLVSVCAEPHRRGPLVERCAQAGKHLYLDKPLCATLDEARSIVAATQKAGVITQMFSQVHGPAAQRVRRALAAGRVGTLQSIHLDLCFAKGHPGDAELGSPREEHAPPAEFELPDAKRELYNIGVYGLAMLDWLLGRRVERVHAVTSNYFFTEHQQRDMEDAATVVLALEGGLTASLAVGRVGFLSHRATGVQRTHLMGDRGLLTLDAFRPRLEVASDSPAWQIPPKHVDDPLAFWSSTQQEVGARPKTDWLVPAEGFQHDAKYFLDCIEQGTSSDVPAELAARVMEVLHACYASAASGRVIEL